MMHSQLFRIAYLTTNDLDLAVTMAKESADVRELAESLLERLPRKSAVKWEHLDLLLRTDTTTTSFSPNEPPGERYLWAMKRACLALTLQCLSPAVRLAFILTDVCRLNASEILGIGASALTVRLTRAREYLDAFLSPRCSHMQRANLCSCKSRVGIGVRKGLVSTARPVIACPPAPHDARTHRRVGDLYKSLPIIPVNQ